MLQYIHGNILESNMQTLANPVNCRGVMGKGVAKQFAQRFPDILLPYRRACDEGRLIPGKLHLCKSASHQWVLNFPTKNDWREDTKLSYIEDGLCYFLKRYKAWGITSIAFPALGCGLGGLPYRSFQQAIERALSSIALPVEIYRRKSEVTLACGNPYCQSNLLADKQCSDCGKFFCYRHIQEYTHDAYCWPCLAGVQYQPEKKGIQA